MITGPAHLKIVLMPSRTRLPSLPNSGPRWSITGMSIARRMRSGTGVGPGICRKWRPAVRDEFWTMVPSRASAFWHINGAPWSLRLVAIKAGCEIPSSHPAQPVVWSRNGRAIAAGTGTQAEGRDHRRRDVRPIRPRALCDRRLALPDDATWRGRAAHDRGSRAHTGTCARGGGERAAAWWRHLAVRPDRQP